MLLVEGDHLRLSEAQKIRLMESIGVKDFKPSDFERPLTIRLQYLDGMTARNKNNPKKIEKPASLQVPAKSSNVKITGLGTGAAAKEKIVSEVIYYETFTAHETLPGEKIYAPKHIEITQNMVIYDNQSENREQMMERLWYFVNASKQCKDSANFNPNTAAGFRVHNPAKIASEQVSKRKERARVDAVLYGIGGDALTDGSLRGLAKSMFIPMVDAMEPDQVRVAIENTIEDRTHMNTFLKFISSEGEKVKAIRQVIMEAIEGRVIGFNGGEAAYAYMSESGSYGTKICTVKNVIDETKRLEELCDHFAFHTDQYKLLEEKMAVAV